MEEWEKEEMAAMWRFQGACDASAIMHEQERQIKEKDREIRRMYGELQRRKERGEIKEYEIKWDDFAKPDSGSTHSHFRHFNSNASEGQVRYIQKKKAARCMCRTFFGLLNFDK